VSGHGITDASQKTANIGVRLEGQKNRSFVKKGLTKSPGEGRKKSLSGRQKRDRERGEKKRGL